MSSESCPVFENSDSTSHRLASYNSVQYSPQQPVTVLGMLPSIGFSQLAVCPHMWPETYTKKKKRKLWLES